jgi:hypothetical protein
MLFIKIFFQKVKPIGDENHFFHQILLRLSEKLPFGYFGIPLFSFFKILTLNRNINSERF